MAVEMLAAAALALLPPYLLKAGESFAEQSGEKLADKAEALY